MLKELKNFIERIMNRPRPDPESDLPRLCGYHFTILDRPGQKSLLDSANCEVCKAPAHARR